MKKSKYGTAKVIFTTIFGILAILFTIYFVVWVGVGFSARTKNPSDFTENWMASVPDDMPICDINIPGTHDSTATYVSPSWFLKTQNSSISTQLKNGFRYLDLRIRLDDKKTSLIMCHNMSDCRKNAFPWAASFSFDDIVDEAEQFLSAHPSESIIFCIKPEKSYDDISAIILLIQKVIAKNKTFWYTKNEIPLTKNVRGKIILARRFSIDTENADAEFGMDFRWQEQPNTEILPSAAEISKINDAQMLVVQDRYKYKMNDKWKAVIDTMNEHSGIKNRFLLNFLSTMEGNALPHPKKYAKNLNQNFMNLAEVKTSSGIWIFDWGTQALAEKVILNNRLE